MPPQSWGACDGQVSEYNDYAPTTTCDRSTDWSQWHLDQTLFDEPGPPDYCTSHCSPSTPVWENPGPGPVGDEEIAWDWDRELWWDAITPYTADDLVGKETDLSDALEGTTIPAWGFLWLRPPGPEIDSGDPMGRGWTDVNVNKYNVFHTHPPTMSSHFQCITQPSLPTIYDFIPWDMFLDHGLGMGMPLDALGAEIINDMSYISAPSIAMSIIPPEASIEAGALAYADGLVRNDAALGGLTVTFIDGGRLDARAGGYSTGSAMGSVPDTIGFAHTRFGWGGEQGIAGLAVFGGMLRSGQKDNSLWIGEYGGLDADGIPFIEWGNVTPLSGEMPDPRSGAALVFDESGRGLVLFGGELDNGQSAKDIWTYHLERESWSPIDIGFPGLTDFQAVQYRGAVYIAGGTDANGVVNALVYKLSLDVFSTLVVANLADGPGARDHVAIGFDESRMGKLVFYGGVDANGAGHNDLWEYDLENGTWSMRKDDCLDEGCPQPGARSFIVIGSGGRRTAVYGPVDERGNRFFLLDDETNEWIGNIDRAKAMEPSVLDCDGDGIAEEETTLACRSSDEWYAEVGRMECLDPGQSDLLECGAKEPEPMTPSASWSPGGWEWIVDLAEGPDDYTYVLTDDTLYTFDTLDLSSGLYPIDSDELIVPGSCWFCGGPDWSSDVKVEGGYAMVGSSSGVHVFDLSDPSSPVEVGHFASYGPVVDIAAFNGLVYLADGFGVTVLTLFDPSAPQELGRAPLGTFVEAIGVNADNRNLMALTPGSLRRLEISVDATKPVQTASVGLAGLAFWSMKVYGEWTYLNGLWTQTVLDNRTGGLETRGPHDVRSWVGGRILREDRAERVKWLLNTFQVWEE